jgi:hypothetical protein
MRIRFSSVRALLGIALVSGLTGCLTSQDIPAYLSNTSGSKQIVAPNAQAPEPLTVTILDQDKNPMSGVAIDWEVQAGGGTLSAAETSTNDDGVTSVNYTAGASTGDAKIVAKQSTLGAAVTFMIKVQ